MTTGDDRSADGGEQGTWIVLVEATPNAQASLVEAETVCDLLVAIGDKDGAALHCPDRVAVQVRLSAVDAAEALSKVLRLWRGAVGRLALPDWNVVRAEVLTPEEFQRDF